MIQLKAQVIEISISTDTLFKRICYISVPDTNTHRRGIIFYYLSEKNKDHFLAKTVGKIFSDIKTDIAFTKFKGEKYRYEDYSFKIIEVTYQSDLMHKSVNQTINIEVRANRFHYARNVSLRRRKITDGETVVYNGIVVLQYHFIEKLQGYSYNFENVVVQLNRNGLPIYNEPNYDASRLNGMALQPINFSIRELDAHRLRLKKGKENFYISASKIDPAKEVYFYIILDLF